MMLRRSLASALFAAAFAAGAQAQGPAPFPMPSAPAPAAPQQNPTESLNARFANGIVAVADDKIITIADVQREVAPLLPQIQAGATSQQDFDQKLENLYDSVIQDLIDRVLIIKEFKKDEKRRIPDSFIDNQVAEILNDQFDNDRSKFLAYLRARGTTTREFRREQEEDTMLHYMQGQQRKSQSIVSPVKIETYYNENKDRFYQEDEVHLRLIQLTRGEGDTDASLLAQANMILAREKNGEKFEDLAKEFSKDSRRSKGGDWGPMKRSDLKKEFSDAVFTLKKGETSAPLVLPEGAFLLYVENRKYAGIQPIDDVRDQIERILVTQMSHVSQERWLERLRRNSYVKHY